MTIGKNTIDGQKVMDFVHRVEAEEKSKKVHGDRITAILAAAKSDGFSPIGIRAIVKARKLKPSQFREGEDIRDIYFHAGGLADEPPLFRSIAALAKDDMGKDALIETMAKLVPNGAAIVVEMSGNPVRISRSSDGVVTTAEVKPEPKGGAAGGAPMPMPSRTDAEPPPDVTPKEAKRLGREAFKENKPITANPFPFGDKRQGEWEAGWQTAAGSDGMGPE